MRKRKTKEEPTIGLGFTIGSIIVSALICFGTLPLLGGGELDFAPVAISLIVVGAVVTITGSLIMGFSKAETAANEWINQPDSSKDLAESYNADYVNASVTYHVHRLGDKKFYTFGADQEKGKLIIDGKRITVGDVAFSVDDIQWLGLQKNNDYVRMDVNIDGWWYQINIDPGYGGADFVTELRKRVSENLNQSQYTRRPEIRTHVPVSAHITQQNLQGIFEKRESVDLFITPLWMVVMHNGYVIDKHFIDDIADIRCTKHPTDLNDQMLLLTFEIGETAYAYALKDKNFAIRLSDAAKEGIDSSATQKKKQQGG